MKRILALLLSLVMIMSLFTACGDQTESKTDKEETEQIKTEQKDEVPVIQEENTLGFSDEVFAALTNAVVLRNDTPRALVDGVVTMMTQVPMVSEDAVYIPGAFVTVGLGGSATYNEADMCWTLEQNGISWTLNLNSSTVEKNGQSLPLNNNVAALDDDFLISAKDYTTITGTDLVMENELIVVGDGIQQAMDQLTTDGKSAMMGIMEKNLANVAGADVSEGFDHLEISKVVDVDTTSLPMKMPKDVLVAVCAGMYVEELGFKANSTMKDSVNFSMVVYNTGLTYGVAESYTQDGVLVDRKLISPHGGRYQSVSSAITNAGLMIGDTVDWITTGDMSGVEYRNPGISTSTEIELVMPKDGYVFITNNPQYSEYVAASNAMLYFAQLYMCMSTVSELVEDGTVAVRNKLIETAIDVLCDDPAAVDTLANMFRKFLRDLGDSSPVDLTKQSKLFRESFAFEAQSSLEQFTDIMDQALEITLDFYGEAHDVLATEILSKAPLVGETLELFEIIADGERLICLSSDMVSNQNNVPLVFCAADWRTAYAKVLREVDFGNSGPYDPKFALCYIDTNSIPELVVMDGATGASTAQVLTYTKGEILRRATPAGAYYGSMIYYEFGDVLVSGSLRFGVESIGYTSFMDPNAGPNYYFSNDYYAVGENDKNATYTYNNATVFKWYYNDRLAWVEKKYSKFEKLVLEYDDCYYITESNIQKYIEKK